MEHQALLEHIVLIFAGCSALAIVALMLRLPIIIAYIIPGLLLGPHGFALVNDPSTIESASHIGILFLLFLLGLDLQPTHLAHMLKKTALKGVLSSIIFCGSGFLMGVYLFDFSTTESLLCGAALMFSSTIIGIKLLPTSSLHHKHIGEVVISLLLLQDLIAILVLVLISGGSEDTSPASAFVLKVGALVALITFGYFGVKKALIPLMSKFDRIREFLFLSVIGWCLVMSWIGQAIGLSWEIGAFIAGISLAISPIAQFFADQLKPLRDFFLVLFFFSVGAHFNPELFWEAGWMMATLALFAVLIKPIVFRYLFLFSKESASMGQEVGVRLGQISEFSLLIILLGAQSGLLGERAVFILSGATILTFAISSWRVVNTYQSPIASKPHLLKD